MNTKEISNCLNTELEILNKLKSSAMEKQKALICSDSGGIDLFTHQEEALLAELRKVEADRLKLLNNVKDEFQLMEINNQQFKLSNILAGKIVKEDLDTITLQEFHLRNIIIQLKEINQQNQLLVQNSLEFINETMLTLLGTRKHSLVDRRI
ncbi:MAG: flagellar export chaperone FlgN [Ignavibacteriales bacterium]|nr:flagellar export chaperone FlgN [Ignavibacteriales bacterium]